MDFQNNDGGEENITLGSVAPALNVVTADIEIGSKISDLILRVYVPSLILQLAVCLLFSAGAAIHGFGVYLVLLAILFIPILIVCSISFGIFYYLEKKILNKLSLSEINQFKSPFLLIMLVLRTQLYIPFLYIGLALILSASTTFSGPGILRESIVFGLFVLLVILVCFLLPFIYAENRVRRS